MSVLDVATCLLGVFTTTMSAYLGWWFSRVPHQLGPALAMMLGAEAFAGAVTTLFAATSAVNAGYTWMTPEQQTLLRWSLFVVTSGTSVHLACKLREISSD